jgi:DNA-binding MarR family transcriptional regulator
MPGDAWRSQNLLTIWLSIASLTTELSKLGNPMNAGRDAKAYEITWLIRRLFRSMTAKADEYLHESGLSAADRAVMEFLYPDRQLSVPEIARRYDVSRQHVQVTVNSLLQRGLARSIENPRHKRSRLIRLSSLGKDTFAGIRRDESAIIAALFEGMADEALDATQQTLAKINERLRGETHE